MNWLFSCRLKRKDFHGQRYFGRIKNSILIAVVEQLNFHHTASQEQLVLGKSEDTKTGRLKRR
jgi:hypothetical protein